ncbi:MAG: PIN domain-containing protein [Planctomycetaceae bacterium]|nr:MAG: PIN domain-containing protein [Planctomycetaceae bacterium]
MKKYVVDASVVAAAFFREDHADRSGELLAGRHTLHAPDLIHAELANVIWKRYNRGEISSIEAGELLEDFRSLPLQITPCGDLVETALDLALPTGRSVYDCLYLALGIKSGSAMVSADKRLVNALADTPLAKHIVWIGDFH